MRAVHAALAGILVVAVSTAAWAQAPDGGTAPAPNPYRAGATDGGATDGGATGAGKGDPSRGSARDGGAEGLTTPASADGGIAPAPVPFWEMGPDVSTPVPDAGAAGGAALPPEAPEDTDEQAEPEPDEQGEQDEDRGPSFVPIPVPSGGGGADRTWELARELVPMLPEGRTGSMVGLLLALVVAIVATSLARRARDALPDAGVFPRLLQVVHTLLRLAVAGLIIALLVRLLPPWMGPALPWVLLAAAAAIGWSARDVLPDVVAGVVMLFERRIRRGVWISGEDFSGTVLGVGLRATWVIDARGHRIAVPNRRLMSGPIVSDSAVGAEHEVTLRMGTPSPAGRVRQALHDAVLQSPWVPPQAEPVVLRDPDEPHVWHVRSRLLEARYAPRFEGELLERAEEVLAHGSAGTFPLDEELDDA